MKMEESFSFHLKYSLIRTKAVVSICLNIYDKYDIV